MTATASDSGGCGAAWLRHASSSVMRSAASFQSSYAHATHRDSLATLFCDCCCLEPLSISSCLLGWRYTCGISHTMKHTLQRMRSASCAVSVGSPTATWWIAYLCHEHGQVGNRHSGVRCDARRKHDLPDVERNLAGMAGRRRKQKRAARFAASRHAVIAEPRMQRLRGAQLAIADLCFQRSDVRMHVTLRRAAAGQGPVRAPQKLLGAAHVATVATCSRGGNGDGGVWREVQHVQRIENCERFAPLSCAGVSYDHAGEAGQARLKCRIPRLEHALHSVFIVSAVQCALQPEAHTSSAFLTTTRSQSRPIRRLECAMGRHVTTDTFLPHIHRAMPHSPFSGMHCSYKLHVQVSKHSDVGSTIM